MEKDNRTNLEKLKNIGKSMVDSLPVGEEWFEKRLEICNACEFNSENVDPGTLTGIDKLRHEDSLIKRRLMPNYLKKAFCTKCTCPIENKCSVKFETCGLAEKGLKPKWVALEKYMDADKTFSLENLTSEIGFVGTSQKGFTYNIEKTKEHGPKISFAFVVSRSKPVDFLRLEASCGCTVPSYKKESDRSISVNVDFSTKGLKTGLHRKSITVFYTDRSQKAVQTFPITIQYNVKNDSEL